MQKLLLICTFFLGFYTSAQQATYLIKAGKLFDSESGQFKTGQVILVKGNTIDDVKAEKDLTAAERSAYTTIIDLSPYTVTPGLIDAHTHLLNREVIHPGNNPGGMDMAKILTLEGDAYRAVYGVARAKAFLENGITAVQDLGNSGNFADVALRRGINEGLVPGPRMRCSGPGLATEGGQLPGLVYKHRDLANDEYRIVKGVDDAVQAVRENLTQGADVIKIYANNTPNNTMLSIDEIAAIVREAHRYGVRVTAHATSNTAAWNAIMGGVDGIEHGYELADTTLEIMAKRNVVLVPTFGDSTLLAGYVRLHHPGNDAELKKIPDITKGYMDYEAGLLQRVLKKKVTIVAGSDDYVDIQLPMGEWSKHNLMGYQRAGIPIPDILKMATSNAAKHLRWEGRIGVLKKGAFADIAAFDADLDTNLNALLKTHFVMKDGNVYVNDSAKR
jgi:imidazolonepropionase-like amidohydrolase